VAQGSGARITAVRGLSSVQHDIFAPLDQFQPRHMGSQGADKQKMLEKLGFNSLDELLDSAVPSSIRLPEKLVMDKPLSETEALAKLKGIMSKNKVLKSFIGMGYYETNTPHVILRNVGFVCCVGVITRS
jgi:glycine dehydrogenase